MKGLHVFYDLMSQPCRAVYLFLKINKIPYTERLVALRKGEHLAEEYGKINPFHLVPAMVDDDFKLTESVAILKYLADKYKVPDHWYPKDLQRRAVVDSFMAWQHLNLRMYGAMVFRIQVIEPRQTGKPIDPERLADYRSGLEVCLDHMENIFLRDQPYLAGPAISIADLLGICELMQPISVHHDVFIDRPKLKAWSVRVLDQLQPHFDEAHRHIYKLRDMFKPKL